jgi:hypothetical protein
VAPTPKTGMGLGKGTRGSGKGSGRYSSELTMMGLEERAGMRSCEREREPEDGERASTTLALNLNLLPIEKHTASAVPTLAPATVSESESESESEFGQLDLRSSHTPDVIDAYHREAAKAKSPAEREALSRHRRRAHPRGKLSSGKRPRHQLQCHQHW